MDESLTAQLPGLPATFAEFKAPAPQGAIAKMRYSHKAMVDMIVANPWISQGELARNFGYTEGWVSQVIASDAFQAYLAERKNELIDPHIRATIDERMKGLVARSIEILMRKLDDPKVSDETALKALEIAGRAAGYGNKSAQVQLNQQFVVQVPLKHATADAWIKEHGAGGSTVVSSSAGPAEVSAPTALTPRPVSAALVAPGPAAPPSLLDELKGL
jgi:hypothetical protein